MSVQDFKEQREPGAVGSGSTPGVPGPFRRSLVILASHGWLMSVTYLCIGVLVELLNRFLEGRFVMSMALALDSLPISIMRVLGVWNAFAHALSFGRLSYFWARCILVGTTMGFIFATALMLALVLSLAGGAAALRRR